MHGLLQYIKGQLKRYFKWLSTLDVGSTSKITSNTRLV